MHNQHSEPQGTQEDWKRRAERAETQLADARREVERLTNASIADGTRRFLCSQELAFAFQAWRERMDKELRNSVSCETYRAVWADCEQLRAEVARISGPSQGTALKYILTRKDGKPIPETARFFVLRLDNHGKKETAAAQAAVLHYAQSVLPIDPDASAAAYRVLRNLPPESTIQPAATQ